MVETRPTSASAPAAWPWSRSTPQGRASKHIAVAHVARVAFLPTTGQEGYAVVALPGAPIRAASIVVIPARPGAQQHCDDLASPQVDRHEKMSELVGPAVRSELE